MLDKIESQIKELAQKLESSAAQHNYLLGMKNALETLANDLKLAAPIVEALDPALTPAIDTAESVANAIE